MKALIRPLFLGKVWHHYEELLSTNAWLADLVVGRESLVVRNFGENTPITNHQSPITKITEGVVITTFNQTAGRGQMGNTWLSEPQKNIAFSILLHPHFLQVREQFHLNKAIALAVHDFFENTILTHQNSKLKTQNLKNTEGVLLNDKTQLKTQNSKLITVKWANDIYVNDKKIAGILIQNSLSGNNLQSSIVGIGLNINQLAFPKELNATSLALETGIESNLFDLIENLTLAIERRYLQLKNQSNFDHLHAEYLSKMYRFDQDATFVSADGRPFRGKIVDVTKGGQLAILTALNGVQHFNIKEVKFEI